MYPALAEGEVVEVDTHAFRRRDPRPGDIVLARHPFRARTTLVKRVHAVTGDRYDLRGDDPIESEDSRGFGPLPRDAILGLVVKPR
jgi:nickel-type superoxide dismutase maturation protease